MLKYKLSPPEIVTISGAQVDVLISAGNSAAALLYLYILRRGGEFTFTEAASATKLPHSELSSAIDCLQRLDFIDDVEVSIMGRADVPPEYSFEDIRHAELTDLQFATLIKELTDLLGKLLSSGDLSILFGIYDYLKLPAEVILLMARYLADHISKTRGRKPSMRELEKEAYHWSKLDVTSLDAADVYMVELAKRNSEFEHCKLALGVYGMLSARQEKYLNSWYEMGFRSDALEMAYERTINNIGSLSWPYVDKIICNWHIKRLHLPTEIELGDPVRQPKQHSKYTNKTRVNRVHPQQPSADEIQRIERLLALQQNEIRSSKRA